MSKNFVFSVLLLSTATFIKSAGVGSDVVDFNTGETSADRLNTLYYSIVDQINKKDFKQAQQLIEQNLDSGIIHWTIKGKNFLHYAALFGNLDFFNFLLDHSFDFNLQDLSAVTPLMVAANNKRETIVKILLEKGADASLKDVFGLTAFLMAARAGSLGSVQTFVEFYKAQGKQKELDIKAAIAIAQKAGQPTIVDYLKTVNQ